MAYRRRRWRKKAVPRRKPEKKKLHKFTPGMIEKMSAEVRKNDRYKKKWIRLDHGTENKQRVWKNALFLTPNIFAARVKQKRGAILYHICAELDRHVLYCKLPRPGVKEDITCPECLEVISGGVQMIVTLQKLSKK